MLNISFEKSVREGKMNFENSYNDTTYALAQSSNEKAVELMIELTLLLGMEHSQKDFKMTSEQFCKHTNGIERISKEFRKLYRCKVKRGDKDDDFKYNVKQLKSIYGNYGISKIAIKREGKGGKRRYAINKSEKGIGEKVYNSVRSRTSGSRRQKLVRGKKEDAIDLDLEEE